MMKKVICLIFYRLIRSWRKLYIWCVFMGFLWPSHANVIEVHWFFYLSF